MENQNKENGVINICSNYNQMRAYAECSPNHLKKKKIRLYPPFMGETFKIPEK